MRRVLARVLAVVAVGLLPVLAVQAPAGAAKPYEPVDRWSDTEPVVFQIQECGLDIMVSGVGHGVFFAMPVKGSDGQAFYGHDTYTFTETWTTENGTMTLVAHGAFLEKSAVKVPGPVTYESLVFDPDTGEPVLDPDTGEPVTEMVTSDHVWQFDFRDSGSYTWYDEDGKAVLRFTGPFSGREQFDLFGDSMPGGYPIPGTFELLREKRAWPGGGDFCTVITEHLG